MIVLCGHSCFFQRILHNISVVSQRIEFAACKIRGRKAFVYVGRKQCEGVGVLAVYFGRSAEVSVDAFQSLGKVNSILVEGFHAFFIDDRHTRFVLGVSLVLGRIFGGDGFPVCCQGHESANAFKRVLQTWVTEDFVGDLEGKTSTCRATDRVELGRIALE